MVVKVEISIFNLTAARRRGLGMTILQRNNRTRKDVAKADSRQLTPGFKYFNDSSNTTLPPAMIFFYDSPTIGGSLEMSQPQPIWIDW